MQTNAAPELVLEDAARGLRASLLPRVLWRGSLRVKISPAGRVDFSDLWLPQALDLGGPEELGSDNLVFFLCHRGTVPGQPWWSATCPDDSHTRTAKLGGGHSWVFSASFLGRFLAIAGRCWKGGTLEVGTNGAREVSSVGCSFMVSCLLLLLGVFCSFLRMTRAAQDVVIADAMKRKNPCQKRRQKRSSSAAKRRRKKRAPA